MIFWRKSAFDTLYYPLKNLRSLLWIGKKNTKHSWSCWSVRENCVCILEQCRSNTASPSKTQLFILLPAPIQYSARRNSSSVLFRSWETADQKEGSTMGRHTNRKHQKDSKRFMAPSPACRCLINCTVRYVVCQQNTVWCIPSTDGRFSLLQQCKH